MKTSHIATALGGLLLAWMPAWVSAQQPENPFKPFDQAAFEAHARGLGADDEALEAFRAKLRDESPSLAADALLRSLCADYRTAAAEADAGEPKAALSLAALISSTADSYVRAHARYQLGRVFLDADEPEKSGQVLADFLQQDRNKTPLDSEVAFFYATSLAEIPMPGRAATAFENYLELFPDAAERFRAVALQRRSELEAQFQNPLHEIADVMKGVERKIRRTETGKPTRDKQDEIVLKLEEIIEQLEEQEKQSSGSPSGNQQSQSPASNSAAPPGAARIGSLDKMPGVADRWGDMKDRDRKAIETEVHTKLPPHWEKLLQDYYEKLNRGGSR